MLTEVQMEKWLQNEAQREKQMIENIERVLNIILK